MYTDGLPIGSYYVEEEPGRFIEDSASLTVVKQVAPTNGDESLKFPRKLGIHSVAIVTHAGTDMVLMHARLSVSGQKIKVTWQDGPVGYGYSRMEVLSEPQEGRPSNHPCAIALWWCTDDYKLYCIGDAYEL